MFKKNSKGSQPNNRVEPEIDSGQAPDTPPIKTHTLTTKPAPKVKKKSNWFNWFVPILLTSIGVGFLVLYPEPDPQQINAEKAKKVKV